MSELRLLRQAQQPKKKAVLPESVSEPVELLVEGGLPEGWKEKTLGELTSKIGSGSTPKGGQSSYKESGISLIRSLNVHDGGFARKKLAFIDNEQAEKLKNVIVEANDVLLNITGASVARCCIVPEKYLPARVNQHVSIIRLEKGVMLSEFLHYALISKTYKDLLLGIGEQGSTRQAITKRQIENFVIAYPASLKEQKQIVAVLDQSFIAIDQAKANIEKNLQNATELFQSKLNEIFTQKGEGWEDKTLGETCVVERGSSPRPIKKYQTDNDDGVNWVKIGDTKGVEKYIYSTKERITKEGSLKSRFVDVGDFILSNSMSFGRPYIMKTQGYIHDGWFVLRLPEDINTEFFWYLLVSPYTKSQFESLAAGAIVKNISGDLVKKASLPIPPLAEQEKIVVQMDILSSTAKKIEAKYIKELKNLNELKKSILQKAFAGELV